MFDPILHRIGIADLQVFDNQWSKKIRSGRLTSLPSVRQLQIPVATSTGHLRFARTPKERRLLAYGAEERQGDAGETASLEDLGPCEGADAAGMRELTTMLAWSARRRGSTTAAMHVHRANFYDFASWILIAV